MSKVMENACAEIREETKRREKLEYQEYIKEFLQSIQIDNSGELCSEVVTCPEPIEFIKEFDNLTSVAECRNRMNVLQKDFQRILQKNKKDEKGARVYVREDSLWLHETAEGINLQPGHRLSQVNDAVVLNDDIVHTVVVGRTGSGKSVFLNHLIMTLLHEYAPWELDIYLADFKKVELSRYMTYVSTPHLRTCAATSEIRYVVSMLEHLHKCMLARQNLLAKLGIQKLSDFRRKFDVVLPRVVLIVDEFQQMYEEASTKDGDKIHSLIHSIIKLGRATGFHLIFASQEMSGALNGNELANFKARFALNCDGAISSLILGNAAASKIARGRVIVNTNVSADNTESNKEYQVPFIEADNKAFGASDEEKEEEPFFYECLRRMNEKAAAIGFCKQQIFYQEDSQKDIDVLDDVLQKIERKRNEIISDGKLYYDVLTLGQGVVYSKKKYDLETVYLERGHNKNIMAVCSDLSDLVYVQKLLANNFKNRKRLINLYFDLNPLVAARYDIAKELNVEIKKEEELSDAVKMTFFRRHAIQRAAQESSVQLFIQKYYEIMCGQAMISEEQRLGEENRFHNVLAQCQDVNLLYDFCLLHYKQDISLYPIVCYYWYRTEGKDWSEIFTPFNIWISGLEYMADGIPKYLPEIMKRGMEVNMLFLLFASDLTTGNETELIKCCDYFFAKSEQEKIYSKFDMNYAQRSQNNIVIDFKIKSLNTERAFKKYRTQEDDYEVPSLNFDELLSEE